MTRLTISLSDEEAKQLRDEARMLRISVSELARLRLFQRENRPELPPWVGIIEGPESMTRGANAKDSLHQTWAGDIRRRKG